MTAEPFERRDDVDEVPVSEVRDHLADLLNRVDREGRRVYVTNRGRRVGALVPVEDVERVEQDEDTYWSTRARRVLDSDEDRIPWDEAVRMLESETADG